MPNKYTCGYWKGKLITIPTEVDWEFDLDDGDNAKILISFIGKKVEILAINNNDEDPVEEIYVTLKDPETGKESDIPINFGHEFPIEIAEVLGYAGLEYFGEKRPLINHSSYYKP